ncbi:hypothetical protein GF340_02585 [Candidatus Peregrinibacteria bacterium]|nr:hypothetical protein [Candidatus Peregrinibacteria bacterium]
MNWFNFIRLMRMIYGKNVRINLNKIQKMGLLAVKIGQVHALRLDFLPVEKCQELAKLYRSTIPIDTEKVLSRIDSNKFKEIDDNPLASASVGQVHKASLKDGTPVVIKIIKNNFKEKFKKDVRSVRKFVKTILFFYPKLKKVFDPIGILEHIEDYTLKELNLLNEIEGHETLKAIYDKHKESYNLSKLVFPKIYKKLSSENIMVSEYIPGKTFDEVLESDLPYEKLLDLFHIHGFYIFNIGTFHGDIHPGNLMHHNDKIYFIDTGAIGHVKKKTQKGLFNFFDALSQFDYPKSAYYINEMAEQGISHKKYEHFQQKFLNLYQDFTNSTVSQVSLTKKMMETIKLGVNCGMKFDKGMFAIIKSLMFLDGMVLRNNPDAILLKDMRRFIGELNSFNIK